MLLSYVLIAFSSPDTDGNKPYRLAVMANEYVINDIDSTKTIPL
jgi:hypothetical protein